MTPESQIKALAELDGWKNVRPYNNFFPGRPAEMAGNNPVTQCLQALPAYLTSYNAIIPLIQKQWKSTNTDEGVRWQFLFWNALMDSECMLFNSPAQLCEALLRALDKWKD